MTVLRHSGCAISARRLWPGSWRYRPALAAAAAAVSGCTVLTSETPEQLIDERRPAVGVFYSLPRSVIDLKLVASQTTSRIDLVPSLPRTIPDPKHRYVLRYQPLPNYDDEITVAVGPNSFLKSVKADTTDRTPDIIVNIAKLFGRLGGGLESDEVPAGTDLLGTQTIDPADQADVDRALMSLNDSLLAYVTRRSNKCRSVLKSSLPKIHGLTASPGYDKRAQCADYERLRKAAEAATKSGNVDLGPVHFRARRVAASDDGVIPVPPEARHGPPLPGAKPTQLDLADCTVGLCYRPLIAYEYYFAVEAPVPATGSGSKLTSLVRPGAKHSYMLLPNEAPLVEIDIRRGFFINKIQEITFSPSGHLATASIKKDSELLAVAKLPVAIVRAMLDVVQFRVRVLEEQTNEAEALAGLIEARRELASQKAMLESALVLANERDGGARSVSALADTVTEKPQSAPASGPRIFDDDGKY